MACECPKGAPAWMATYADMMSLLLCFFILLVAMANFDVQKTLMAVQSIQGGFGVMETFPTVAVQPMIYTPKYGKTLKDRKASDADAKEMKKKMDMDGVGSNVKVKVTETGVAVMLNDPTGFVPGDANLTNSSRKALDAVAQILSRNSDAKVRVEGHTDDVPIHTAQFPSNWELSSARALNVVKYLAVKSSAPPANLSAVGYGEHRPLVPNTTTENRQKNRRIEIYIDYTQKQR